MQSQMIDIYNNIALNWHYTHENNRYSWQTKIKKKTVQKPNVGL